MEILVSTTTPPDKNNLTESQLNKIRDCIEKMNKYHQIKIGQILLKQKIYLNENNNGIHVNLTDLTQEVIDLLIHYIDYAETQEKTLNDVEKQKEIFKNTFFS